MGHTAACLRRSVVEVEWKFLSSLGLVNRLHANLGPPVFRSSKYMGRRSFKDVYYDHDGFYPPTECGYEDGMEIGRPRSVKERITQTRNLGSCQNGTK